MSGPSAMSTLTDPLFNLTLQDPRSPLSAQPSSPETKSSMAPPETVRERALIMQDILSSFDPTALPPETQTAIFNNIVQNMDKPLANRPRSHEWTIQSSLVGTLLQRAAYSTHNWDVYKDLQSADNRAVIFRQKIESRFKEQFEEYDSILSKPPPTAERLRSDLKSSATKFRYLSNILATDRERRQYEEIAPLVESQTVLVMLNVLEGVCQRSRVVHVGQGTTRQTRGRAASTNDLDNALFALLVGTAGSEGEMFLLEALDQCSGLSLRANSEKLKIVHQLLDNLDTPPAFVEQYQTLCDKAGSTFEQNTLNESTGQERGLETDPRPGSKRVQGRPEEAPKTPKRGRRTSEK